MGVSLVLAAGGIWAYRLQFFNAFFIGAPITPYRISVGYLDEFILIGVGILTLASIFLPCYSTGDDRIDRHDVAASRLVIVLACLLGCTSFTPEAYWLYLLAILGVPLVVFIRLVAALVKSKVRRSFQRERIGIAFLTICLGVFVLSVIEMLNPMFVIAGT